MCVSHGRCAHSKEGVSKFVDSNQLQQYLVYDAREYQHQYMLNLCTQRYCCVPTGRDVEPVAGRICEFEFFAAEP